MLLQKISVKHAGNIVIVIQSDIESTMLIPSLLRSDCNKMIPY